MKEKLKTLKKNIKNFKQQIADAFALERDNTLPSEIVKSFNLNSQYNEMLNKVIAENHKLRQKVLRYQKVETELENLKTPLELLLESLNQHIDKKEEMDVETQSESPENQPRLLDQCPEKKQMDKDKWFNLLRFFTFINHKKMSFCSVFEKMVGLLFFWR